MSACGLSIAGFAKERRVGGLELVRVQGLHLFHHHTVVIILHERAHMEGSESLVSRGILCVLCVPWGDFVDLVTYDRTTKEMGWGGGMG